MKVIYRYITIAISLLVVGYLVYTFSSIVIYVITAWLLSMLGQPLMRFFQRYVRIGRFHANETVAALLTIVCFFIVLLGLLMLFVPLLVQETRALMSLDYGKIGESLSGPIQQANQWLIERGITVDNRPPEQILHDTIANLLNSGKVGAFFSASLSTVTNVFVGVASVVFITFFFLKEQGLFVGLIIALLPEKYEPQVREVIENISHMLTRYFSGVLLQITIIAVYVSIFLTILGVKNALLIGFFAALMNLIPYLGPALGGSVGILIVVTTHLDADFYDVLLPLSIKVLAVFITVQWLDNYYLTPTIFSNTVKAHPLEIFIVILIGAQIGGVVGMVAAIPAYTVIRVIAREFLSRFRIVRKLTDRMDEEVHESKEIEDNKVILQNEEHKI